MKIKKIILLFVVCWSITMGAIKGGLFLKLNLEKLSSFPAGAKESRIFYHETLKSVCYCIDDTIDTTSILAWRCSDAIIEASINSSNNFDIETLDKTLYKSIIWNLSITDSVTGNYYASEIMFTHDGTNSYHSVYAIVGYNILFTIDINIVGSNIVFNITNNDSNTIDVHLLRKRI